MNAASLASSPELGMAMAMFEVLLLPVIYLLGAGMLGILAGIGSSSLLGRTQFFSASKCLRVVGLIGALLVVSAFSMLAFFPTSVWTVLLVFLASGFLTMFVRLGRISLL